MSTFGFITRLLLRGRLEALTWLGSTHPETARLRIGNRRAILLNTPELVEEVLVRRTDECRKGPALRIHARPLLGRGLLTSEGDEHIRQRRLVAPAFAHQRVPRYAEAMSRLARETCESWRDGAVPMHREMTRLTLAIVGRTLFDVDLIEDADEIATHITHLMVHAMTQTRSFRPVPYEKSTRGNRRAWKSVALLDATIYRLIEERRQWGEDKGDVLSMLLLARDEDGHALTDKQVRDEAMTLFLAGHETTANAATWALYLLARYPDVQETLRDQVWDAVGNRPIGYDDLIRIPFALQVFKEALRLFPPAFIVIREPLEDMELRGGIRVRKGELMAMCEWVMHRNPKYFPDPERFDPTRFTPENEAAIHKYAYFPFGAGKRVCIGNQFALMEGQIILATAIQYAALTPVTKDVMKGDPLMTLRPKGPATLHVERMSRAN